MVKKFSAKKPQSKGYHCWLTNITKNKIVLSDLKFTLKPYQTIDILDERHSIYTVEQVANSIKDGSISKRLNKSIFVRMSEPPKPIDRRIDLSETSFPYKQRTIVEVKKPNYEELEIGISDEEYANENADSAGSEQERHLAETNKFRE